MSTSDFSRLLERVKRGEASTQEKIDFVTTLGRWQEIGAASVLRRLLTDVSEDVRYYALRTMVLDGVARDQDVESDCWRLIQFDSSGHVRGMAAVCIGSLHAGTQDYEVFSRLKARMPAAADRFEAESILEALYNIAGHPPAEWPTQRRILSGKIGASPAEMPELMDEAARLEKTLGRASK